MDSEKHACPVCGQPVATVVKRYKTLGAWVPRWVGGPCRNRECEAYLDPDAPAGDRSRKRTPAKKSAAQQPAPQKPAPPKPAADNS